MPKDTAAGIAWLRKAADQGFPSAQFRLALKYQKGEGVPQDKAEAYKWYCLAAKNSKIMADLRDIKSRSFTPAQIAEGQRRASAFLPKSNTDRSAK